MRCRLGEALRPPSGKCRSCGRKGRHRMPRCGKRGRAVEGTGLENQRRGNSFVGSNPTASAGILRHQGGSRHRRRACVAGAGEGAGPAHRRRGDEGRTQTPARRGRRGRSLARHQRGGGAGEDSAQDAGADAGVPAGAAQRRAAWHHAEGQHQRGRPGRSRRRSGSPRTAQGRRQGVAKRDPAGLHARRPRRSRHRAASCRNG